MATDVIAVGSNGWIERRDRLALRMRVSIHGYFRGWWHGVRYFHRDGSAYVVAGVRPPRSLGVVDRALAASIYNPSLEFAIDYAADGSYSIQELRDAVRAAVEADDDILTQFHDREALLARLKSAESFDEVVAVIVLAETPDDGDA